MVGRNDWPTIWWARNREAAIKTACLAALCALGAIWWVGLFVVYSWVWERVR